MQTLNHNVWNFSYLTTAPFVLINANKKLQLIELRVFNFVGLMRSTIQYSSVCISIQSSFCLDFLLLSVTHFGKWNHIHGAKTMRAIAFSDDVKTIEIELNSKIKWISVKKKKEIYHDGIDMWRRNKKKTETEKSHH